MNSLANGSQKTVTPTKVALTWLQKHHAPSASFDELRGMVLQLVLAHPKQLGQWIEEFTHYRDAEGFTGALADTLADARILQQPEYKAIRRKLERGAR